MRETEYGDCSGEGGLGDTYGGDGVFESVVGHWARKLNVSLDWGGDVNTPSISRFFHCFRE